VKGFKEAGGVFAILFVRDGSFREFDDDSWPTFVADVVEVPVGALLGVPTVGCCGGRDDLC
jgi:hypothetical protein